MPPQRRTDPLPRTAVLACVASDLDGGEPNRSNVAGHPLAHAGHALGDETNAGGVDSAAHRDN
jgi:hypothetical protein